MAIEIKVPVLGDGIESGDVLDVFVKEGDEIAKDAGVIELETDKATVTVPAPSGGKVSKVHVQIGQTVKIGEVIVTLEGAGSAAPAAAPKTASPVAAPAAAPAPKAAVVEAPTDFRREPSGDPVSPVRPIPALSPVPPLTPVPPLPEVPATPVLKANPPQPALVPATTELASIPAGPAMRRFAREVGVDLRSVVGSGSLGRITRDDILSVVRSGTSRNTATLGVVGTTTASAPSATPAAAGTSADNHGPIRVERMSKIRATIAQKMHESWTTVPRVTNFDDADVTDLEFIRQNNKKDYEARGIKLTTLPFLIKAVAMSLKAHPTINASIDMQNNQIIYKDYINVGIAIDSERGLVVPSLRGVDKLAIPDIARNMHDLAENVRAGKFSVDDLRGGTFTISNLGAIGGTYSTPIINVPETAILLVGRSRKLPVVVGDQVVVRLMMPLSLSYDHRLIDGATAARFLNDVIGYLEAPSRLLLAL
jgi:pyruvate dehydrogenase E2 component (dihydrolipoamide acetyltransferase)